MWGLAGLFPVEVLALGLVHMQPPALYLWVSGFPPWPGFCSDFSSGQPWLPMIHCLPVQSWGAFLGSPPAYGFKDCRFYNLFSIYPCFGNWKSVHLLSISNRYWLTPIYLVYVLILCHLYHAHFCSFPSLFEADNYFFFSFYFELCMLVGRNFVVGQ